MIWTVRLLLLNLRDDFFQRFGALDVSEASFDWVLCGENGVDAGSDSLCAGREIRRLRKNTLERGAGKNYPNGDPTPPPATAHFTGRKTSSIRAKNFGLLSQFQVFRWGQVRNICARCVTGALQLLATAAGHWPFGECFHTAKEHVGCDVKGRR